MRKCVIWWWHHWSTVCSERIGVIFMAYDSKNACVCVSVRRHNNDWKTITKCKMFSFVFDRSMSKYESVECVNSLRFIIDLGRPLCLRKDFVCVCARVCWGWYGFRMNRWFFSFSFFFLFLIRFKIDYDVTGKSFEKLFKVGEHSERTNRFQLMQSLTTTNERTKIYDQIDNNTWKAGDHALWW